MRVFVVGRDESYIKFFKSNGFEITYSIQVPNDIVVFTGGADVSPSLYGEENVSSHCNPSRDANEQLVFNNIKDKDVLKVGICRGAQFLHVMNGGKLWQDVSGHAIGHTHEMMDVKSGRKYQVTSTHHQMMREGEGEIIAYADGLAEHKLNADRLFTSQKAKEVLEGGNSNDFQKAFWEGFKRDLEVVWHEDTNSLCFQGHPEFDSCPKETQKYFFNLIKERI